LNLRCPTYFFHTLYAFWHKYWPKKGIRRRRENTYFSRMYSSSGWKLLSFIVPVRKPHRNTQFVIHKDDKYSNILNWKHIHGRGSCLAWWIPSGVNQWQIIHQLSIHPSIHQLSGKCFCNGLHMTLSRMYLKAKEELWKLKYFTLQKYNVQKIL
jgi:hypothetical protein